MLADEGLDALRVAGPMYVASAREHLADVLSGEQLEEIRAALVGHLGVALPQVRGC